MTLCSPLQAEYSKVMGTPLIEFPDPLLLPAFWLLFQAILSLPPHTPSNLSLPFKIIRAKLNCGLFLRCSDAIQEIQTALHSVAKQNGIAFWFEESAMPWDFPQMLKRIAKKPSQLYFSKDLGEPTVAAMVENFCKRSLLAERMNGCMDQKKLKTVIEREEGRAVSGTINCLNLKEETCKELQKKIGESLQRTAEKWKGGNVQQEEMSEMEEDSSLYSEEML